MAALGSKRLARGQWALLALSTATAGCNDTLTNGNFAATGGAFATEPVSGVGGTGAIAGGTTPSALAALATVAATNVAVTAAADTSCKFPTNYSSGNGSLTWYSFSQGSAEVNCSYRIATRDPDSVEFVATGNGQYFAAMNTADYNTAALCGACVEVTRDNGQTVTATVVDQCPVATNPKCKAGHLDLSIMAFQQVGTETEGYLGTVNGGATGVVSWRYIPCPSVGNVAVRFKEAGNVYWNEFLVENHRNPIAKFEALLSGTYVTAVRKAYNYFSANEGNIKSNDWPLVVRITDIHGSVIVGAIPKPSGSPRIDFGVQFPACAQ